MSRRVKILIACFVAVTVAIGAIIMPYGISVAAAPVKLDMNFAGNNTAPDENNTHETETALAPIIEGVDYNASFDLYAKPWDSEHTKYWRIEFPADIDLNKITREKTLPVGTFIFPTATEDKFLIDGVTSGQIRLLFSNTLYIIHLG